LGALADLLASIPAEFRPLAALNVGAVILVVLVLFHGAGINSILLRHEKNERRLYSGRPHVLLASLFFGWAVFQMLALHIVEILGWAFSLRHLGLMARVHDAIYFCANAYTTLGYGKVALEDDWRNIGPIISISGLFTFAWTTSSLVTVVNSHRTLVKRLEEERVEEKELRAGAMVAREQVKAHAEQSARELVHKAEADSADDSFVDRRKARKEARAKAEEIRAAAEAEIREIDRKEREDEEKLGQGQSVSPPSVHQ
jgi:hypothetical protein